MQSWTKKIPKTEVNLVCGWLWGQCTQWRQQWCQRRYSQRSKEAPSSSKLQITIKNTEWWWYNIHRVKNFTTSVILTKVLGVELIAGCWIKRSCGTNALAGVQAVLCVILGCDCIFLRGWLTSTLVTLEPVFLNVFRKVRIHEVNLNAFQKTLFHHMNWCYYQV